MRLIKTPNPTTVLVRRSGDGTEKPSCLIFRKEAIQILLNILQLSCDEGCLLIQFYGAGVDRSGRNININKRGSIFSSDQDG